MGLRDWWQRTLAGPPASAYIPPVRAVTERKAWGPYAWSYPPGWALAASSGPLIHGPGAYPWGQRESTALAGSNSVVFSCLRAIQTAYTEAPLKHFKGFGDRKREIAGSPVLDLLRLPNVPSEAVRRPAINWRTMEKYRQVCLHVHGNAYIRKLRNPAGEVVQLWPVNPLTVTPMTDKDSPSFIDFYRRRISPNRYEDIPVADMIHDRLGLDDADHRLGLSPLRAAIREVSTDAVATRYAERLLGNDARVGTVVSVDKEANLSREEVELMKAEFQEKFGGENVGSVGFFKGATSVDRLSFSPDELDLAAIHRIPETRICAVLGVPPGLVGVWAGLERNTYSNAVEMREAFYEGTIVPLYIDGQTALTEQLLRDFGARDDEYLEYDVGELRAFATDENADAVRIATLYEKGIITLNEARGEAGFDTVEGGDESPAKPAPAVPPPPPGNDGQNAPQASPNGTGAAKALALEVRRVSLDDFPALLEALRQSQGEQVTKRVQAYLDSQARRVARAVAEVG
jgi:HK97 family phage portal protein